MNYAFLRFEGFKDKALTLSYDDGQVFDKKLIQILDENGIKCTFNLNSLLFAVNEGERRLTVNEALKLYKNSGHEVAVHGAKHLSLSIVPKEVGTLDIISDRKNLENIFGQIIKGMAYANGDFNDDSIQILKDCGIKYARTCISTGRFDIPNDWLRLPATCHHNDPKINEYIDKFLDDTKSQYCWFNGPKLFYLWGHSYEFNDNDNWYIIENIAKRLGNRSDIWYATNGEIYDYVKAYDNLEYSADGRIIKNNSNIDVYLCYYGKNVLVKAGETVLTN